MKREFSKKNIFQNISNFFVSELFSLEHRNSLWAELLYKTNSFEL